MPIDMSLLNDFRCVLTVPKGGLVRRQQKDGFWLVVQSPKRLRVLYRPSVADSVSAKAGMLECKVLASSAAQGGPDAQSRYLRVMFAGRADAAKANILFDTGASANFVSKSFAKQTGITVEPVKYSVRLADDKTMEVTGEATVFVQLGAFDKPVTVKCYVMDMLYEVDLILGKEFMHNYNCILHYGKGCMHYDPERQKTHDCEQSCVASCPTWLVQLGWQPPVREEKSDSVMSASQLKRLAQREHECSLR
jgi:hypothetical protein